MEFAIEELNTVCFPGTMRQSESKADHQAPMPPLCQTIGTPQASTVNARIAAPPMIRLRLMPPRANNIRGLRNRRKDGRKPAASPTIIAVGTTSCDDPQIRRQQR